MAFTSRVVLATVAVLAAVLYQINVSELIFFTLGVGRSIQSPSDFNARCTKHEDVGLEGCEDMWLHEPSGLLYMACSSSPSRQQWLPALNNLNATGRLGKDKFYILDSRVTGPVKNRLKSIKPINFQGNHGDGALDLHGFAVKVDNGNPPTLKMLVINHRPPMDEQGKLLDGTKVGANSTIELFETVLGETTMRHIKTWADPIIKTPNNVAWVGERSFVFTNDQSDKVGLRRHLDRPLSTGGSVGYCDATSCHIAYDDKLVFPNGLVRGKDDLIYVPSSVTPKLKVFSLDPTTHLLTLVNEVTMGHPVDNLSIDGNGDIYAAGLANLIQFARAIGAPYDVHPPAAAWRVRRRGTAEEWDVVKVVESTGDEISGATVAVHDPVTGRIFFGGAIAPSISICEMRQI